ncbi:hypothetical protein PQO01_19530 [Lentisphaera marina]|uniref:hypothetical protein n=1 Tax=Lentisphaera marina TaxID=1111041 RepID=UPI0023658FDD|nr:hypothetical protein [Lentisphaera marina]MDD7987148.1 hypothetical protein [Lentisphaera marina]
MKKFYPTIISLILILIMTFIMISPSENQPFWGENLKLIIDKNTHLSLHYEEHSFGGVQITKVVDGKNVWEKYCEPQDIYLKKSPRHKVEITTSENEFTIISTLLSLRTDGGFIVEETRNIKTGSLISRITKKF